MYYQNIHDRALHDNISSKDLDECLQSFLLVFFVLKNNVYTMTIESDCTEPGTDDSLYFTNYKHVIFPKTDEFDQILLKYNIYVKETEELQYS